MTRHRNPKPDLLKLKEYLSCDPKLGILTWIKPKQKIIVGQRAGYERKDGYRVLMFDYVLYLEHHIIWFFHYGYWPFHDIDHKNLKTGDNRIKNLRKSSTSQNLQNKNKQSNNTSGYKGVHVFKDRWRASIGANNVVYSLGAFTDPVEAARAYNAKAIELHGAFARLNKLPIPKSYQRYLSRSQDFISNKKNKVAS